MTSTLRQLQIGDTVAFSAEFTKTITNRELRKDFRVSRGEVLSFRDDGAALVKWKGGEVAQFTNPDVLALVWRASFGRR